MNAVMTAPLTIQERKPATPTFMAKMAANSAPAKPMNNLLLKDCLSFIEDMKERMEEPTVVAPIAFDIDRAIDLIEWIKQVQAVNGGAR
jgi:hypothetical protein